MVSFRSTLRRSPVLLVGLGLILGQGAIYATTPLITRIYLPEAVGAAQVMLSAATAVGAVGAARMDQHVAAAPARNVKPLAILGGIAALASSIGACVIWLLVGAGGAAHAIIFGGLCLTLSIIPLAAQISARHANMSAIGSSKASQGLAQSASQLCLSNLGASGLQLGFLIGYATSVAAIALTLRRSIRSAVAVSGRALKRNLAAYWRKSLTLSLAAVLNAITVAAPPLLLAVLFSESAAGHFAIAYRIGVLPAGLVVAALIPVVAMRVGDRLRNNLPIFAMAKRHVVQWMPIGLGVAIFPFLIPSGVLVALLGPGDWGPTLDYLRAVAPLIASLTVIGPLGQVLSLSGRATAQLIWDGTRTVLMLATALVVSYWYGDPVMTVWTISVTQALMYCVYAVMLVRDGHSR